MIASDGIILGSPVYSAGVTSQMKALIDRASMVLAGNIGLLKLKVGASVVATSRGGAISAFDTMNNFLYSKEMLPVGSSYWNVVYRNLTFRRCLQKNNIFPVIVFGELFENLQ